MQAILLPIRPKGGIVDVYRPTQMHSKKPSAAVCKTPIGTYSLDVARGCFCSFSRLYRADRAQ